MKLEIVNSATSPEVVEKVMEIYRESFPECERRIETSMLSLAEDESSPYSLMAVRDDDGFVAGIVSIWQLTNAVYVEHLATHPSWRGNGLGGRVIDEVVRLAGGIPVVLEVEPAEMSHEATRRIGFYKRHGFAENPDFEYIQPPYSPGLPSVRLMLMTTSSVNLVDVTLELHKVVYGVEA